MGNGSLDVLVVLFIKQAVLLFLLAQLPNLIIKVDKLLLELSLLLAVRFKGSLQFILLLLGPHLQLLVLLLSDVRVLYIEEVALLKVVEELNQL